MPLGSRKEISVVHLIIVSAVGWLVVTAAILSAVAGARRSGGYGTFWSNAGNWLDSSQGWLFYALIVVLFVWTVFIMSNVRSFVRTRRAREEVIPSPARLVGRILAAIGGLITLIGLFLPWERVDWLHLPVFDPYLDARFPGTGGLLVLGLGLVWFTFFAIPRKVAALLGLAWGGIAFLLAMVALVGIGDLAARNGGAVYVDNGLYVSMLGSLMLTSGSAVAYVQVKQILPPRTIRPDAAVPPMP